MEYNLTDVASVIRSKNSGPYELTFDIIFKEVEMYRKVKSAQVFNAQMFAHLYHIPESQIINLVHFDPAKAVKITIVRPIPSGALGETDVYGAQQHAPLMKMKFTLS
ncbi:MAG: DUF4387 domain-containing protein [Petrimonas sp.]|uniref:DUF4387 domain-containing protein n=1 Tax=Petrimonas sp. TaxID=2023866 RepID=UPI00095FBA63|nr:DUF4387 domain-containing protein [Petrimonas sp.]MEA4948992.1 DUF4387 domain-containing protein [Petrimonas sp.]MEA5043511.1 DUF4387 domain-containing protein [Petrimonas sp.]MEA5062251.1 DUF4387 domain-containing protein [Petrimonas sp.]OJV38840.1 MAG: acyl-CoA synthetase [Bacteroidia bacterium 43-41]